MVRLVSKHVCGVTSDLYVLVVERGGDELRQPFADPHGQISVHVDGEGFIALLQAADCEVLQRAHVLPEVHTAHLTDAQTTDRDET